MQAGSLLDKLRDARANSAIGAWLSLVKELRCRPGDAVTLDLWTDHMVGSYADDRPGDGVSCLLLWDAVREAIAEKTLALRCELPEQFGTCTSFLREHYLDSRCSFAPAARQFQRLLDSAFVLAQAALGLIEGAGPDVGDDDFGDYVRRAVSLYAEFWLGTDFPKLTVDPVPYSSPVPGEWPERADRAIGTALGSLSPQEHLSERQCYALRVGRAMAEQGLRYILGSERSSDRNHRTIVLFDDGSQGVVGRLVAERLAPSCDSPPETSLGVFFPAPEYLGITSLDKYWRRSFDAAHRAAFRDLPTDNDSPQSRAACADYRWRLTFPALRDHKHPHLRVSIIEGNSASAAAGCLLLAHRHERYLDSNICVSAACDAKGKLSSVSGLPAKVGSLSARTLVVSVQDDLKVRQELTDRVAVWVEPANTLDVAFDWLNGQRRPVFRKTALTTDDSGEIANFRRHYLGDTDLPVPFGGRDDELHKLSVWLDEPMGPVYRLLVAPAGRGKSALLVRWQELLRERDDLAVVYVPISIRFETNIATKVFRWIVARMAELYGHPVAHEAHSHCDLPELRNELQQCLRRPLPDGRRLLLILDGIDEMVDWRPDAGLFPRDAHPSTRVLISARGHANGEAGARWLRGFGWERSPDDVMHVTLSRLSEQGLQDVLERMGAPLDQLRSDVVAQLYRLSDQGDPLLAELYARDLWGSLQGRTDYVSRLRPAELRDLSPGLKGYFDRWVEDHEKVANPPAEDVKRVLDVMSVAMGPLRTDDLIKLTDSLVKDALLRKMEYLYRFVVGDGDRRGYVFAHARFGEYWRHERLGAGERRVLDNRFRDWGRETLNRLESGSLSPDKVPAYLLFNYGRHIERAFHQNSHHGLERPSTKEERQLLDDLLQLTNDPWCKAWEAAEGYDGFLNDVDRAWRAFEAIDRRWLAAKQIAPLIGQELRCSLIRSSVRSLSQNIPVLLMAALVRHKLWTSHHALDHVSRQEPERLLELVAAIPEYFTGSERSEVLGVAIRASGVCGVAAKALSALAPHLPDPELCEVLRAARAITDDQSRASVLSALAPHLPPPELREALREAKAIEWEWPRAMVLSALAPHLPDPELREVLRAARAIERESPRAMVLCALAPHLPDPELCELLRVGRDIRDEESRVRVLSALAPHLSELQKSEVLREALRAARDIRDEWCRARSLAALAPHLSEPQKSETLRDALRAARAIVRWHSDWSPDSGRNHSAEAHDRCTALSAIVLHLNQPEKSEVLGELLRCTWAISHAKRADVLASVAPHLTGQLIAEFDVARSAFALLPHLLTPECSEALCEALRKELLKATIGDIPERALSSLAPRLSARLWRAIEVVSQRAQACFVVLAYKAGLLTPVFLWALTMAKSITDEELRAEELCTLATHPFAPKSQKSKAIRVALQAVRAIRHEWSRAKVFSELAPHLPEPQKSEALHEALKAARSTEAAQWSNSKSCFAKVLSAIAPHVPESQKSDALREALHATRSIKFDQRTRAEVLSELAPHLPEPQKSEALREALRSVVAIASDYPHTDSVSWLMPHLVNVGLETSWCIALRELSNLRRPIFLKNLVAIVPFVRKFAGNDVVRQLSLAISEISTRWP